MPVELLILFGLIVLNGVFSMSEMAVISARKARLQSLADQGDAGAKRTLTLLESPDRFLSTVQIGVTLIGTLAGVFGGATIAEEISLWIQATSPPLAGYGDAIGATIITLLTVYLSLVIGELVPKRLAMQNPERIAGILARPMQILSAVAAPLVYFLSVSSDLVIRLLGVKSSPGSPVTEGEVLTMIEQGIEHGIFEPAEQQMVQGVLALDARQVREILTPRPDIVWLDSEDDRESLLRKLADSVYSAYPVCRGSIDHVVGVVHSSDLVLQVLLDKSIKLDRIMQPPLFIPETATVAAVVRHFKESGLHIGLIVGEDGGVEGLVTLSDIIQEILGEIYLREPQFTQRGDGSWLIDGGMPIARFAGMFPDFQLPENEAGDYQSVAGFVLARLGRIPLASDSFTWHGHYFEVMDMDGVRIDKVLVRQQSGQATSTEEADAS